MLEIESRSQGWLPVGLNASWVDSFPRGRYRPFPPRPASLKVPIDSEIEDSTGFQL